jgi:hypothetical protein
MKRITILILLALGCEGRCHYKARVNRNMRQFNQDGIRTNLFYQAEANL